MKPTTSPGLCAWADWPATPQERRTVLLVDQNGLMQSVAPHDVTAAFVCEWSGQGATCAHGFAAACPHDLACVTAIIDELPRCLASPENNLPCSEGLIEASARAIAGGRISIAAAVLYNADVIFDACVPTAPSGSAH